MNLSHVNPFLVRAGSFTSELSAFVDWGQTSTYGPISQALFTLSAALVPLSPILAIYLFKTVCLALHIFNGYAIWRLLSLPERGKIALAYLIHPLLLMEQVGSGHVDVLVSTSLILFAGCLLRQRYSFSFAALWAGFLAKTIPLIWMPLLLIALVRQRRWWVLSRIGLLSLGLIIVLSLTVLPAGAWHSLLNPGVSGQYQSSLHGLIKTGLDIVRIFLPSALTLAQEKQILLRVSSFTLLGFALVYSWIAFRIYRQPGSMLQLLEAMGWATLILLLLATPWLMPWYASVLLTFAALLPKARLFCYTSLAFGLSSSAQYLLQGHNSLKAAVMIGLPVLVLLTGMRLLHQKQVPDPSNVASSLLQAPQRRIVQ
jgi:alpha-1,6-mannosyltransferase